MKRYSVHGVTVRVTSQWFNPPTSNSIPLFLTYLERRGPFDTNRLTFRAGTRCRFSQKWEQT